MPIQTDLSVSPYFDDFNEEKNYYKVLFRPGVAVQVRELNQLQSILQKQIERFGDNIYKKGSIIDGCNFIFYNPLPYIKINDTQVDSAPVNVSSYDGFLVKNTSNLVARIVKTVTGYESTAPDLNTLYVKYLNGGISGNASSFSPNDILTVYDPALSLSSCTNITVKSSGFSNNDTAVLISSVVVQNSTGGDSFVNATGQACTFTVGDILTQDVTNARAEIRNINTTAIEGKTVLTIRPLASELRLGNTESWAFRQGLRFTTSSSKITANLTSFVGQGASATIITDVNGGIISYNILNGGIGYIVPPYATIAYSTANNSASANSLIDALSIEVKNYKAQVTVNSEITAIGNGYGFGVTPGVIYQKGYFSRTDEHFVIVEKYSTNTDKVVGFDTSEEIIDYKKDFSLYDNATGTLNQNAPGANRLKLTPQLVVLSKSEALANDEFFTIVEFSNGRPFKRNSVTQFNSINKELARRTFEESGNYVLDQFLTTTLSDESFAAEAYNFAIRVDPGVGYLNGYRVQTEDNYYQYSRKGTYSKVDNTSISINYGNYIVVQELGGIFKFSIGAAISLRDATKTYLTSSASSGSFANITAAGNEIGTARIRSLTLVSGSAGEPNAKYHLHLFDIRMNSGKNFNNVRSVFYDGSGTNDGIADIVLDGGKAVVYDAQSSSLVFSLGTKALKNANNISYTYRTINDTVSCNTSGSIAVSISQNFGEYFPYQSTLSDAEKLSLIVTPFSDALCANSSGTVATTSACTTVTGTTTTFDTTFEVGDYVRIANATAGEIKRITAITNSTSMIVAGAVANSYTAANIGLVFPKNVPIPLYLRDDRSATIQSNTTMYINVGNTINGAVNVSVVYNAQRSVGQVPKGVTRKAFIKIDTSTNIANNVGPWCLGMPDIIRLRNVYLGNSSAVTTSDSKITSNFWIDHNQKKDYYDVGFLYKKNDYTLPANTYIMVEYDVMTVTTNGVKCVSSYPINDEITLDNSVDTINTVEIPEMYHDNGEYIDVRDVFDFRPYSTNTCVISTSDATAPVNPTEPTFSTRFDVTTDKKFPAPRSECTATIESYKGRIDAVVLTTNSDIRVVEGTSSDNPTFPLIPSESLLLNYVKIPPYPSLPVGLSDEYKNLLSKGISNINYTNKRQNDYTIKTQIDQKGLKSTQPRRYTMQDIGQLENRIADLEYYTSLSAVEDEVNKLQLVSAANTAENRFKFGYFVDNFSTIDYAEVSDPTYSAQIYGYQLHPAKKQINLRYRFNVNDANTAACVNGTKITLPYTRKNLISQNIATEPTTIEVAITETVQSTTGKEVISTTTKIIEVSTTTFTVNPEQVFKGYVNTEIIIGYNNTQVVTGYDVKTVVTGYTEGKLTGYTNTYTTTVQPGPFNGTPRTGSGTGGIGSGGQTDSLWQGDTFEISKLGGTITAGGLCQKDNDKIAPFPKLQQYKNSQWVDVATGRHATLYDDRDGNGSMVYTPNPSQDIKTKYIIDPGSQTSTTYSWALDYKAAADASNRLFRIVGGRTPNGTLASGVSRGTYPTSSDIKTLTSSTPIYSDKTPIYGTQEVPIYGIQSVPIVEIKSTPIYETVYTTSSNTTVQTRMDVIPSTTIVTNTSSVTKNIFNPKLTAMLSIDNIFNTANQLNDPFVDLAKYIQTQLNS